MQRCVRLLWCYRGFEALGLLSVARGIRAVDRGAPDFERFRLEHHDYVRALERAGLQVT